MQCPWSYSIKSGQNYFYFIFGFSKNSTPKSIVTIAIYFEQLIVFVPKTLTFCGKQARNNLKNELATACSIRLLCLSVVEATEKSEKKEHRCLPLVTFLFTGV